MQTYDDDGFASPEELRDEFMARLQERLNDPKGAARASAVGRIAVERGYARFQAIRDYYHAADRDIRRAGADEWGVSVYEADWIRLFSPIEYALWHDIRNWNAILYPQYPVGRYFVDFGNPIARVAIECDGAKWHQDGQRDAVRQRAIEDLGWSVYRISGGDCKKDFDEETKEQSPGASLIYRIVHGHEIGRGMRRSGRAIVCGDFT